MAKKKAGSLVPREWGYLRNFVQAHMRLLMDTDQEVRLALALFGLTLAYGRYDTDKWNQLDLAGGVLVGGLHSGVAVGRSQFFKVRKRLVDRAILCIDGVGKQGETIVNVPGILAMLKASPLGDDRELWTKEIDTIYRKAVEDFARSEWEWREAEMSEEGKTHMEDMVRRGLIISEEARKRNAEKVKKLPTEALTGARLLTFIQSVCEEEGITFSERAASAKLGSMLKAWIKIIVREGKDPLEWMRHVIQHWPLLYMKVPDPKRKGEEIYIDRTHFSFSYYYYNLQWIDGYLLTHEAELAERRKEFLNDKNWESEYVML